MNVGYLIKGWTTSCFCGRFAAGQGVGGGLLRDTTMSVDVERLLLRTKLSGTRLRPSRSKILRSGKVIYVLHLLKCIEFIECVQFIEMCL